MQTKYLLDECVCQEHESKHHISFRRIAKSGTPDHILLDRAIRKNMVIVTQDKGFILRAIKKGVNIVYQDNFGQRFFIYGSKTEKLKDLGDSAQYRGTTRNKRMKLLSQFLEYKPNISGFYSLFSL